VLSSKGRVSNRHLRVEWVVLVAVCAAADFFLVPAWLLAPPWSARLAAVGPFFVLGCTLAQGNALAAWLAWSEGAFLRRLFVHWGIAAGLCSIWLAALAIFVKPQDAIFVQSSIVLAVPLVSLAAQSPLWLARQLFGWRLVRESDGGGIAPDPKLTIRDLLLAMLVVGGALGLGRLLPQIQQNGMFWIIFCAACVLTAVISSIGMLPAGAILMRQRPLSRALAYSGVYAGSLIGLLWLIVIITYFTAPQQLEPYFVYLRMTSLMLGYGATLILAGVAARAPGYQLVWGRRRH
jgi:hypothetical protein